MSHVNPLVIGLFASLGHTCSIFDHFHGGKAVATSAGILLAYNPLLFLMASTFFVSTLLLTSMASAASIIGITLTTIVALFLQDWILAIIAGILSIVVIWRHRSNISRIFNGTESMVSFGLGNYLRHKKNS
jgi:glycerol-3-phosphate acyltransferase PlsY